MKIIFNFARLEDELDEETGEYKNIEKHEYVITRDGWTEEQIDEFLLGDVHVEHLLDMEFTYGTIDRFSDDPATFWNYDSVEIEERPEFLTDYLNWFIHNGFTVSPEPPLKDNEEEDSDE